MLPQDLRFSIRSLLARQSRGFTLVAVITLALGIGATTAMFSVLYGVLLRPLPYPKSDRLVEMAGGYQGQSGEMAVTYQEFRFLHEQSPVFQYLAATTPVGFNVFTGSEAVRASALRVSRDYFRVLGVSPVVGREFLAEEDQPGGARAVVLSHGFWQRRFNGDANIAGRTISLDGEPYTVVGVMPAGFQSLPAVDVWSTLAQVGQSIGGGENLQVIGRLKPGLSLAGAQAGMQGTTAAYQREFKARLQPGVNILLAPYQTLVASQVRTPVLVLFGAIAFVLLIACANVASLLLGRAAARSRELALRVALGASRGRVMRQVLTESVLLALAGGAFGLFFADWGVHALLSLAPDELPRAADIHLDHWALLFTCAVSLLTGIAFGLMPAWRAARTDVHSLLKEGSGRSAGSLRQGRVRNVLVIGEIALSIVLLVGAGLLLKTFANLVRTDPGFDGSTVLSAEIWLTGTRYGSTAAISDFYRRLTERIDALPGVRSAAVIEAGLPLERGGRMGGMVDGRRVDQSLDYRTITPGFFQTLGVKLEQGRTFEAADADSAEPVAIVNETLARQLLRARDAVGHMVTIGNGAGPRRVVGVVGNMRSYIGLPAPPTVFIPSAQTPAGFTRLFSAWYPTHVVVRTTGDPAALGTTLTRAIQETDAQVPIGRVRTMNDVLAASLTPQRFVMLLLGIFAVLAVVLAAVGIYGLMSFLVAQRTHEIGIRMAIGARASDVLRMIVVRAVLLAATGVALGLLGARALTRLLDSLLFGVTPTDPMTFAGVAAALVVVAIAASALPARRATRVDPIIALRSE